MLRRIAAQASGSVSRRFGSALLQWSTFSACAYLVIVFGYRERVAGISIGPAKTLVLLCVAFVAMRVLVRAQAVRSRVSPERMFVAGALVSVVVFAVIMADTGQIIATNIVASRNAAEPRAVRMQRDAQVWHAQLLPPMFAPNAEHFLVYKRNVRLESRVYGWMYDPAMLASPTLSDSVLEGRHVRYEIGPIGTRDLTPLSACRVFALGDSFVFGFGVDVTERWADRLGAALAEPICNLGISGASPRAEAALLKYLLAAHADSMRVTDVLWMLYEGNDLEYVDAAPADAGHGGGGIGGAIARTVLDPFAQLPSLLHDGSVLRRLLRGELTFGVRARGRWGLRSVDGVALETPLFHAPGLGFKLFSAPLIDQVQEDESYIETHPQRAAVENAFKSMRALADQAGFRVTVLILPSDARLYSSAFEDIPAVESPHVIEWFRTLAASHGFSVLNLLPLLEPFAKREMLYYRDDEHFNARGHAIVAQILEDSLRGVLRSDPSRGPPK